MNHDVFISYSSQNKEAAQAMCHAMEQQGIRCWMAPRDIPYGAQYGDVIDEAIKACKAVVVLFSETAANSQWVNGELNVAFEEQKTIIPFRIDQTPLKGQTRVMLNQRHWIDAFPDYKTKFDDLVSAVAQAIGMNVSESTEEEKKKERKNKPKSFKKPILIGVAVAALAAIVILLYLLIAKQMHSYDYDNHGLHMKVKGLSTQQEEAMSSILDNMVLVEGGLFTMGNTPNMLSYLTEQDSLSCNAHEVVVDNYYISKFEVTQKQWKAFISTEGRCIADNDDAAMDMLSWEDAQSFADTLSKITGLKFSLPTEAQWEFAARGGNQTKNYLFSGNDDPTEVGWTSFDELTSAHAVGGKRYNELGIFDMTGNVNEWCEDFFALYNKDKETNPKGPEKGMNRVLRGGDFRMDNLYNLKVNTRYFDSPFVNRRGAGLRLVININN